MYYIKEERDMQVLIIPDNSTDLDLIGFNYNADIALIGIKPMEVFQVFTEVFVVPNEIKVYLAKDCQRNYVEYSNNSNNKIIKYIGHSFENPIMVFKIARLATQFPNFKISDD